MFFIHFISALLISRALFISWGRTVVDVYINRKRCILDFVYLGRVGFCRVTFLWVPTSQKMSKPIKITTPNKNQKGKKYGIKMLAHQIAKTISSEKKNWYERKRVSLKCLILCRILKTYISTQSIKPNSISTVISCDHFSHRDFDKNDVSFFFPSWNGGGGSKWSWECETSSPNPKLVFFFFAVGYKTQNCRIFSIVISMAKVFYWVYPLPQKIWECRVVEKIKKKSTHASSSEKKNSTRRKWRDVIVPNGFSPEFLFIADMTE